MLLDQHAALVEHGDRLGDHADELHVVLDHDQRAAAVDLADQLASALDLLVGHAGRRLVEQDQVRARRPAPCRARPTGAGHAPAGRHRGRRSRSMPTRSSVSSTIGAALRAGSTRASAASQMFSRTVRPSKTLGTCVLMPTPQPRDLVRLAAGDVARRGYEDRPAVGLSWPVRHLKNVLLPAPLGPIRQRSSPSREAEVDAVDRLDAAEAHAEIARSRAAMRALIDGSLAARRRGRRRAQRPRASAPAPGGRVQARCSARHDASARTPAARSTSDQDRRRARGCCCSASGVPSQAVSHWISDAADDRPDQGAEAADDDPDDDLRRLARPNMSG